MANQVQCRHHCSPTCSRLQHGSLGLWLHARLTLANNAAADIVVAVDDVVTGVASWCCAVCLVLVMRWWLVTA